MYNLIERICLYFYLYFVKYFEYINTQILTNNKVNQDMIQ